MLFSSTYIPENIENFHNLILYFFKELELNNHTVFDETLFPTDQRLNLYKYKNRGKGFKKFVTVFESIFKLYTSKQFSARRKAVFLDDFFASNKISDICGDLTLHPIHNDDMDQKVKKILPLFNALYDSYFYDLVDKDSHFDQFSSLNGKICSICGLETIYQYDHFFPKGVTNPIYPFSCVNPHNLIPICQKCNGSKSSKLIIYENSNRLNQRLLAFSPYYNFETWENVNFQLSNIIKPGVRDHGTWEVTLSLKDDNLEDDKKLKIQRWNTFFDMEDRYSKEIKKCVNIWILDFKDRGLTIEEMVSETTPTKFNIRRTNSIILQNLFFQYLTNNEEIRNLLTSNISTAENPIDLLIAQELSN